MRLKFGLNRNCAIGHSFERKNKADAISEFNSLNFTDFQEWLRLYKHNECNLKNKNIAIIRQSTE